jgi:8-oxo-dGTP pyrophosphatase MutT (NUDIX family)
MSNPQPTFNFTAHQNVSSFAVPMETYLSKQPSSSFKIHAVATGAIVYNANSSRVLLLQRAANDSMPNLWEVPGGACDADDPSILHGCARELWEEAGITAARIGPQAGEGLRFLLRDGRLVCKFTFVVEPLRGDDGGVDVCLSHEHSNYLWASREDVEAGRLGDVEIKFTSREQEALVRQSLLGRWAEE